MSKDETLHRMKRCPAASITEQDVDNMLMDIKMSLVSISVGMADYTAVEINEPFFEGCRETGLSDAICITDDDDDDTMSVAQRLRHIYLRVRSIESGMRRISHYHPNAEWEELKRSLRIGIPL